MNTRDQRRLGLLALPGIAVSLLPSIACPLCWPAYAALASSLGLGFLASSTYLLRLTGALLAIALVGLGLQAKTIGYGPLVLGLVSAAVILPSKFMIASSLMTYAGVVLLVIAAAWSLVTKRSAASDPCPSCAPAGEGGHQSA
jgi:hypothetical protein